MSSTRQQNWFTARELSGLPGLPGAEVNVRKFAQRHNWENRRRLGTKAREYPFSNLPLETQAALAGRVGRNDRQRSIEKIEECISRHRTVAAQYHAMAAENYAFANQLESMLKALASESDAEVRA